MILNNKAGKGITCVALKSGGGGGCLVSVFLTLLRTTMYLIMEFIDSGPCMGVTWGILLKIQILRFFSRDPDSVGQQEAPWTLYSYETPRVLQTITVVSVFCCQMISFPSSRVFIFHIVSRFTLFCIKLKILTVKNQKTER